MTTGSVTSRDGTTIGYLKTGTGPAVVIMHGSMESAASHTLLAAALADQYTVFLPDRRGRGMSGPHRAGHGIATEVEDLHAVLAESRARLVFGVSAGGLIALEAARTLPGIDKVALYEPALVADGARYTSWLPRFDLEIADGNVGAAMVTSMFGLELMPSFLKVVPRPLFTALTNRMLRGEDKKAAPDAITMRKLAPTIRYEGVIIGEMAGGVDRFRSVSADVLLIGGGKGLGFLAPARDELAGTLPHSHRVELPGLDHGASSDPGPTNPGSKPETVAKVAKEVRTFFQRPSRDGDDVA
jgi:pimeloyl-ACP methyl ester carboxylesterase